MAFKFPSYLFRRAYPTPEFLLFFFFSYEINYASISVFSMISLVILSIINRTNYSAAWGIGWKNPSLHPHCHFLAKYSFIYCTSIYVAPAFCLPFSQTPEIYPGTKQKIQIQLRFRKVKRKQTFLRRRGAPARGSWGRGEPAASGRGKGGYRQ